MRIASLCCCLLTKVSLFLMAFQAGYREGISSGRNDAAQEGFNHGFKDSVMIGYKWGIVRGVTR